MTDHNIKIQNKIHELMKLIWEKEDTKYPFKTLIKTKDNKKYMLTITKQIEIDKKEEK